MRLNLALVFVCVHFVLYEVLSYGCMLVFVVFDLVLFCGVIVSPGCGCWRNNLNEPLDPYPFLGGC